MLTLPGLIDTHVHLREPGWESKEDFETGTKAAIAGGYTTVLDMPNNPTPIVDPQALEEKMTRCVILNVSEGSQDSKSRDSSPAKPDQNDNIASRIYADLGFHFGGALKAAHYFNQIKDQVFGLKVYMNHTTGPLLVEDQDDLETIFETWHKDKVLMVHAEGETLQKAIDLAKQFGNKLHVCHVSLKTETEMIKKAKQEGLPITCEVTAHHLFLTQSDQKKLGPFGMMRPPLSSKEDQDALWEGINDGTIDTIASDHAPHTKEEKLSDKVPNGVPGLETTLPLLLTAFKEDRLTEKRLIELTSENPRKIFNIPPQFDTVVEVDPTIRYTLDARRLYTKCGWTPFEGMQVSGKIKKVVLRGQIVYKDGEVLEPARGQVIYPEK